MISTGGGLLNGIRIHNLTCQRQVLAQHHHSHRALSKALHEGVGNRVAHHSGYHAIALEYVFHHVGLNGVVIHGKNNDIVVFFHKMFFYAYEALNASLLETGLVNKVYAYIAGKLIMGRNAKSPVMGDGIPLMNDAVTLKDIKVQQLDNIDILLEGNVN